MLTEPEQESTTADDGAVVDQRHDDLGIGRSSKRRGALTLRFRRSWSRLWRLVVVLLLVSFATYAIVDLLPGDPAIAILGEGATEEQLQLVRDELQLERPMPVRYLSWLGDVVTGDLGNSYRTSQPVWEQIQQRIPVSLELMLIAQLMALIFALPLGIAAARRPGGWLDRASMTSGYGLIAMPPFILGMLLIVIVSGWLGWLPAAGYVRLTENPLDNLRTVILPSFCLAASLMAVYQQLLRADMIGTLQKDFVLMAKAKGLTTRHILLRHALRPSSFSLVTLAGLNMGRLIGGSVIVEVLFAIPGVGQLMVQSIYTRDFLVLQGLVLLVAVAYVVVNMLVDLAYTILDPRVRADG